ncbi:unnamed protein product [Angiostrongylus costaricensis]|uniref:Aa_trans domain-containing protein n=1 Tax=Angiostrongylus costaricensis TaxID=334426 RepID=A0A0R3PNR3_ANGCS|nr:unnamed protein product [Angiostrongylus costaricensis]
MTGTYAGQFVMEGFIQVSWPKWKRVLVTRAIAVLPTLAVTFIANGVNNLTGMNDFLNCVQMVQLPFALIPIITFTSSQKIMHDFRSSRSFQIFALVAATVIIAINIYFIFDYVISVIGSQWFVLAILAVPTVIYVMFIGYLVVYCFVACEFVSETIVSICKHGLEVSMGNIFSTKFIFSRFEVVIKPDESKQYMNRDAYDSQSCVE